MKATYEDVPSRRGNASFVAYRRSVPYFPFKWHYHPEYELTLITRGRGKRLVGDSHESFSDGDLVLIGPNVPHTWVSDRARKNLSSAIVIQFSQEFIDSFLRYPEFRSISGLLESCSNGLYFPPLVTRNILEEIAALPRQDGLHRITGLVHILQHLSKAKGQKLASPYFNAVRGKTNEHRINTVCEYIQKNFAKNISLRQVALLIGLSDTAFCKFFKRVTGKTLTQYINEIRIGHACILLSETDNTVAHIAFECGFESLTYFNRVFLRLRKLTPTAFRQRASGYEK